MSNVTGHSSENNKKRELMFVSPPAVVEKTQVSLLFWVFFLSHSLSHQLYSRSLPLYVDWLVLVWFCFG